MKIYLYAACYMEDEIPPPEKYVGFTSLEKLMEWLQILSKQTSIRVPFESDLKKHFKQEKIFTFTGYRTKHFLIQLKTP